MRARVFVVLSLALAVVTAACGDDGADPGVIEVVGVDYGFEELPETVKAGTSLTFRNDSEREFHEMVVIRLPDGEERSVSELLALPEEETADLEAGFTGVAFAMPGTKAEMAEGPVVLEEPGRYVVLCFVPTGADPAAVNDAFAEATDGPPEIEGGPPHAVVGMVAEVRVEA